MTKVAPSVLASDFAFMAQTLHKLEECGADLVHCDVMDGSYVPNISFGAQMIAAMRPQTGLPLDVHLMIVQPQMHVGAFAEAGADFITFHPETCYHPHKTLCDIKAAKAKPGIVLTPGLPVTHVRHLLPLCDMVLLMSVNPGWGGQAFIPEMLDKARELAALREEMGLHFEIEMDGGIDEKTGRMAVEAGVDVLVAGSSIFNAADMKAAIQTLQSYGRLAGRE